MLFLTNSTKHSFKILFLEILQINKNITYRINQTQSPYNSMNFYAVTITIQSGGCEALHFTLSASNRFYAFHF